MTWKLKGIWVDKEVRSTKKNRCWKESLLNLAAVMQFPASFDRQYSCYSHVFMFIDMSFTNQIGMYDTELKANLYKEWGEKQMQRTCKVNVCVYVCEFLTLDG